MECTNCGGSIVDNCCLKCGRLVNGNKVDTSKNNIDKYELQKKFNKNFDSMNRNEKPYIPFFLGPLYFSYRGHFIVGTIMVLIDFLLYYYNARLISGFFVDAMLSSLIIGMYLFINRVIYAVFSNSICLLIDNIKIKWIQKKYKDNYLEKIEKNRNEKIYLFLTILLYVTIIIVFALVSRYKNGLL